MGILTEMPPEAATKVNEAIGKYEYKQYMKPLPGGGAKPARKMGIQAAVLLYFEGADEAAQKEIIEKGLERYREIVQPGGQLVPSPPVTKVAKPKSGRATGQP